MSNYLNKKITEIFKKTGSLMHQPINFEEFWEAIDKLGVEINMYRIKNIQKRLKEIGKLESEIASTTSNKETK